MFGIYSWAKMDQNSWASPRARRDCWVKLASKVRNNTFQPTVDLTLEACFTYTLKGKLHPELNISEIIYFLSRQCKFGWNFSHKCTRALTQCSLSRSTTWGCNSNRVKSWPHFVLFEREEVSIPSVWLSVTTANITEVEICPGSRTDVFISSPSQRGAKASSSTHSPFTHSKHTQIHPNTQTLGQTDKRPHISVPLSVHVTPWVPLWAGRQRKPSMVTGNQTLRCVWKTHARLHNYQLAYLRSTFKLEGDSSVVQAHYMLSYQLGM